LAHYKYFKENSRHNGKQAAGLVCEKNWENWEDNLSSEIRVKKWKGRG
jgi:hypothetical protein